QKAPWLRGELAELSKLVDDAIAAADKDPLSAVKPLGEGRRKLAALTEKIEKSQLSEDVKRALLIPLGEKSSDLIKAIVAVEGVTLRVVVDGPVASSAETAFVAVPGRTFEVTASFTTALPSVRSTNYISLQLPAGWNSQVLAREHSPNDVSRFKIYVP